MKSYKFFQIIFLSVSMYLIITFFNFMKINNVLKVSNYYFSNIDNILNNKSKAKRMLFSQEDYNDLCLNRNYTDNININSSLVLYKNFTEITKNFSYIKEDNKQLIKDIIIKEDNSSAIKDFVISALAGYIIFWIFAVITIIAWIVYSVCCCCKACLCCKSNGTYSKISLCSLLSFIIFSTALVGIIAVCIIGFVLSGKLPEKLDNSQCALMDFYLDAKNGEDTDVYPRWIGVDDINIVLDNLIVSIDNLNKNSEGAFTDLSFIESDYNSYNQALNNSYENIDTKTTVSPNPLSEESYKPGFIRVSYYN